MKADKQNEYISKYEKACNRMIKLPNGETCTFLDVVEDYVYYFKSDPDRVAKSYGYTPEEFKKFVEENSILSKLVKNTEKTWIMTIYYRIEPPRVWMWLLMFWLAYLLMPQKKPLAELVR